MYKKTSKSTAFHTRSANDSTKGSRTGFNLLGMGCPLDEELSDWEKAKNIVAHLRWLDEQILSSKKGSKQRRELGLQKHLLAEEISDLKARKKLTSPRTVAQCFVDICKAEMQPVQFRVLITRALSMAGESTQAMESANGR